MDVPKNPMTNPLLTSLDGLWRGGYNVTYVRPVYPNADIRREIFLYRIEGVSGHAVLRVLQEGDDFVRDDDTCMSAAMSVTRTAFGYASKRLRNDCGFYRCFVLRMRGHHADAIARLYRNAPCDVRMHPASIQATLYSMRKNGYDMHGRGDIFSDAFLKALVEYHARAIAEARPERVTDVAEDKVVIGDRDYFMNLIGAVPEWLSHQWVHLLLSSASDAIRDDDEAVKTIVRISASAYQYASPRLRSSEEFYRDMLAYYSERGYKRKLLTLFSHAAEAIRFDPDLFMETLEETPDMKGDWWRAWNVRALATLLSQTGDAIRESTEIASEILRRTEWDPEDVYNTFSDSVRKSPVVIRTLLEKSFRIFAQDSFERNVDPSLHDDPIIVSLVIARMSYYQIDDFVASLKPELQKDEAVRETVRQRKSNIHWFFDA